MPENDENVSQMAMCIQPCPAGVRLTMCEVMLPPGQQPSYEFADETAPFNEIGHVDMTPDAASKLLIGILDVLNGAPNNAAPE